MSSDESGERTPRTVVTEPSLSLVVDCGGHLLTSHGGRFRRCSNGHVHCSKCHREARRHLKGWTCGKCPGTPPVTATEFDELVANLQVIEALAEKLTDQSLEDE